MESGLRFGGEKEEQRETYSVSSQSSSYGVKLVPWMSWHEWLFVYHSLFSHSPHSVASALTRIATWRSRGCLPVTVEVTASIVEIQQKDPHFRKGQATDASDGDRANQCAGDVSLSEEMLAMLYCMAIMRLVNGIVEKTRKQRELSIAAAADAIGMPRTLIDIRHEGSHRELPALQVVRAASAKALDWLISYYWEPQKKAIPFQGDTSAKIRKRIESKLHELALSLKDKEASQSSSPSSKCKRNKKQIAKILKNLVGLYSSCSSEVVSVLLDFFLKALNSPNSTEPSGEPDIGSRAEALLEDWKLVLKKFSHKEPELLVALLKSVLDIIEIQENMKCITGTQLLISADNGPEVQRVDHLSSLFTWLIRNLKELKPHRHKDSSVETKSSSAEPTVSKAALMQLLRKCLMLSASGNELLMDSTFHIAQLIGEDHLMKKLDKFSSLVSSNSEISQDASSFINSNNLLVQQNESISQATKKLELIKHIRSKRKLAKTTTDCGMGSSRKWAVATSWNPCPIGMLPNSVGSSGCLPVLDCQDCPNTIPKTPQPQENSELNRHNETIEPPPTYDISPFDSTSVKKRRMAMERDCLSSGGEDVSLLGGVNGQLMIGGVWRKVGTEDLLAIKSSIRILI